MKFLFKDKVVKARAENSPKFRNGDFGRVWSDFPFYIDDKEHKFWIDMTWGHWLHFSYNGRWYALNLYDVSPPCPCFDTVMRLSTCTIQREVVN